LLAGDIHRIGIVNETLLENRQVSKFFRDHQVAKAVFEEKCIEKFGKPLLVFLVSQHAGQVTMQWYNVT
jgi:hypothetical protein